MKLSAKVLLCGGVAGLVAGYGIIAGSRDVVHSALLHRIAQSTQANVRGFEKGVNDGLAAGDEGRLLPILQELLKASGAVYAAALDGNRKVVGHTNVAEVGKFYRDGWAPLSSASGHPSYSETWEDGRSLLHVTIPVAPAVQADAEEFVLGEFASPDAAQSAGALRVGIPLEETLAVERRISGQILRVVLAAGLVAGALVFLLIRRLLAPIGLLAVAIDRVRGGDYRAAVPTGMDDEIGELARSFNEMSEALGRTTVSKDFLNDILDGIQDQVFVTDAAGVLVLVNPAAARLVGRSEEELIGSPAAALLDSPGVSFGSSVRDVDAALVTKTNERVPVLFSSGPIVAPNGEVTGHIGITKDVSELRKVEARMRQSEKLSAVGQLAAGVAHEINNPLGVILGFSQCLVQQVKEADELAVPVKAIEREAQRCKTLVQNLLTFARNSPPDLIELDLNDVVTQALALIAPEAKLHRVTIQADLDEGIPAVLGNRNQLEQVVINLAKNALDAMPNGGTLSLSSETVGSGAAAWVSLKLVDDGTGIPPDVLPKIFDPFFTTKPVGKGTGLGLSLVCELVQKHAGEVSVKSRPGRTEFTVKLPARPAGAAANP